MGIKLCHISAIPDEDAIGLEMDGKPVIAIKWKGEIYLYHNNCPHQGTRLDWQPNDFLNVDRTNLLCSTHGAEFEIKTGQCVLGPIGTECLRTIPFEIEEDYILAKPD